MDKLFNQPKRFGQILDHTFKLSKRHFPEFFFIMLLFFGPIYLIQALIQLSSGVNFFREIGTGETWLESVLMSFEEPETAELFAENFGTELSLTLVGMLSIFLAPVAVGAIMFAIDRIRKGEEYTVGSVIKQAFSRYWPMLGSTILYGIIIFSLLFSSVLVVSLIGIIGAMIHPAIGFLLALGLFLAIFVVLGYFLTRWSFYFCSVVFNEGSPGFTRSWRLTKGRAWATFGLFIIFSLIIVCISSAIEFSFGLFLGNSVLLSIIINVVSLFTLLLFTVGYAVIYFDLKVRHDADDLKEMIDDYRTTEM